MSLPHFIAKGSRVEVEINRNVLFHKASNANSRTLKVKVRNHDREPHTYDLVLNVGTKNWGTEGMWFVVQQVTVNPGDVAEVNLDLANGSDQIPNYQFRGQGFYVYVDGDNQNPDVHIPLIWTFDVNEDIDKIAQINFNKSAKYSIYGGATTTWQEKQIVTYNFFILDSGETDYIPAKADVGLIDAGLIIAINPHDKEAGVVKIKDITSTLEPGKLNQYFIELKPVSTGYFKVGADIVVDYNKLGNWLGSALAWITALGADAVSVFLNNKFIQYLFLQKLNPLLTNFYGIQNITIDAYVDPNDKTKVHIVIYTYYNVNDDPGIPLAVILAIIIAATIITVSTEWMAVEISRADVQKKQIEYMKQADEHYYKLMTDKNLSEDTKKEISKNYRPVANSISQLTGVQICEGWAIGNSCISWKVFLGIAAAAGILLFISTLRK